MKLLVANDLGQSLHSDLFRTWERFFDSPAATDSLVGEYDSTSFLPACDALDTNEHYLLSVDLPGMRKEDIKVELNANIISISGERKSRNYKSENLMEHYEKKYGHFKRIFKVPATVDLDKVEARYEDGVLELCLPKTIAARPRTIEIQTGKNGIFDKLLGVKKSVGEFKEENAPRVN